MMLRTDILIKTLLSLVDTHGADQGTKRFLDFLEEHHLLARLPGIVRALEAKAEEDRRYNELLLTSAYSLDTDTQENIRKYVGAPRDATIRESIDAGLIGGFVAEYQGVRYDASTANELRSLTHALKN